MHFCRRRNNVSFCEHLYQLGIKYPKYLLQGLQFGSTMKIRVSARFSCDIGVKYIDVNKNIGESHIYVSTQYIVIMKCQHILL